MFRSTKKVVSFILVIAVLLCLGMTTAFAAEGYVQELGPETGLMPVPMAETKYGTLQGFVQDGVNTFLGVKYADAERFEKPTEPESWEGVRTARAYGFSCPIIKQTTIDITAYNLPRRYWVENEDCQYMNIWTPTMDPNAKKPVLVYLHGGGFHIGSSVDLTTYDSYNLSRNGDVVAVNLNHRLAGLGFLDLSAYGDEYKDTVNLGMADIEMALRWVQENIEQFGGDPDNVLIYGQSGGSSKTNTLLRMPSAEGLFHKAMMISGTNGLSSDVEKSQELAAATLEKLGLDGTQIEELKEVPVDDLVAAAAEAQAEVGYSFQPIADGEYLTTEISDWAKNVPVIAGSNISESQYLPYVTDLGNKNEWDEAEVMEHMTARFGDNAEAALAEYNALFPEKKDADAFLYDNRRRNGMINILTDISESTNAPLYNYLFTYEFPVDGGTPAFHSSELAFLFDNLSMVTGATGGTQGAYDLQDAFNSALVNFVWTGDPSPDGLTWEPFTVEGREAMIFDVESGMKNLDDTALLEMIVQ